MSVLSPIPFQTFKRMPLSWGTEPTPSSPPGSVGSPVPGSGDSTWKPESGRPALSVVPVSFGARVAISTGIYPLATRVATQSFTTPIGLLTASLSTSIVNAATDAPIFVIVARDCGASLNVLSGNDMLITHICEQGLAHSFRSGVGFADDIAPKYGTGEKIALYVSQSGTGAANSRTSAVVILRYFSFA